MTEAERGSATARGPILFAGRHDRVQVAQMLACAFLHDPAFCYIFPEEAGRERALRRLFALLFDSDGRAGMLLANPTRSAATFWRGPGQAKTGRAEMVKHALPLVRALGRAMPRALRVAEAVEANFPAGPFWYLHVAGVHPGAQGHGLGREVIGAGLRRLAGHALPVYLETATERNVPFYRSFGFDVTHEWQVPRGGPRFWSMMRDQRSPGTNRLTSAA